MKKILFIVLIILLLPSVKAENLTFEPTKGIIGVVSFGDSVDVNKLKGIFGEITQLESLGINSDGVDVKSYNFSSGFGCLTGNDKILQMWITTNKVKLDTGVKIGDEVDDITEKYGKFFVTEGDPKFGQGLMVYNLLPDHILIFAVNLDGECENIMSADCSLISKISPSSSILSNWASESNTQNNSNNSEKLTIKNDKYIIDGSYMIITGNIVNNIEREFRYVKVTAKIFNAIGQIIDEPYTYIEGLHLKAMNSGLFTIISPKGQDATKYELLVNGI